ncbi:DNA translocase FtsK [Butyrivibrio proteoclasticus]|uniref:DNA translocase FtsK n=1 Tax=Butyrivibrio proteoclasticus TaxID=43305 RepID=UPI00047B881C|nr:DNA translocase FtsK [Butyrivibrio proteoclasticus]
MAASSRGRSSSKSKGKSQTRSKAPRSPRPDDSTFDYSLRSEIIVIAVIAVTVFLFLCNFGLCGKFGNFLSSVLFGLFGITAYIAPIVALLSVVIAIANFASNAAIRKIVSGIIIFLIIGIIAELLAGRVQTMEAYNLFNIYNACKVARNGGGAFGGSFAYLSYKYLSLAGTALLLLLVGIASLVVFTEHSFVGGLKKGGKKIIERTREDSANLRDYAERHREKMEQRRAEIEEEKRLLLEQKEDEKILRMEKKVSGVMIDTELSKEDEESDDTHQIKIHTGDEAKNVFIPDEDISDDIHEIVLNKKIETDVEPDGQRVFVTSPRIHGMNDDIEDEEEEDYSEPVREEQPVISTGNNVEELNKSWNKLVAKDSSRDEEDILPDVPVHAEHLGNGMNGDYVVHAQDHIGPSSNKATQISQNASSSSTLDSLSSSNRPVTTSPGLEKSIEEHKRQIPKKYVFPPISLLEKGTKNKNADSAKQLKETALKLQDILATFGVNATVTDISQGPAVTRFELQPEAGVRVSKIVNLSDDIKMNLAASDIRIEAPIPGKAAVGIEVPNKENTAVKLRDLLESSEYKNFSSKLAFAVGKDIAGKTVVTDIAKMPHLLIAGATGSGKSVCINTIIMSLIYKSKPEEVQMIMIDPKIVELSVYNGIPHLMIPVVTDPKKAAAALNWAVAEMTNRYKKFADAGVRDLKGYNKMAEASSDDDMTVMPQIVVIVDELADLMMVSASEVEDAICRLTQLARAAGIHLIIATQRPSVDVITGLIKANMPSRIAFAVSSGVDSRTILDITGAEKLLGKGDMLFYPQGYTKPARVQGAFVSDKEVQEVTDFLRKQGTVSTYSQEIEEQIKNLQTQSGSGSSMGDSDSARDEYFVDAGNIIIEKDKASIGMLQRAFKIGFNRAARIMDQLCEAGVVGDEEGTKPRKILMTKPEFDELVNNLGL